MTCIHCHRTIREVPSVTLGPRRRMVYYDADDGMFCEANDWGNHAPDHEPEPEDAQ